VSLEGRVAVVTGAGRGIGAAIASALAASGAAVVVWDLDGGRAGEVAGRLTEEHGVRAAWRRVDVSDGAAVEDAVESAEAEVGPIDVLVNNAGIDVIGRFLESDEASWDRVIAVNLKGTITTCHRVVRRMVERGSGRVVNVGSDAGKVGSSGEAVYSATKGGVIAFTKTLAREVASAGVTVNCICPGPTDTALLAQLGEYNRRLYDSLARSIPLGRIAQPAEIAPVVVFLAGDGAAYITGQALSVSGGLTMC
jgi:2-hydroxycyclohexanecarboxyl-CoA dehydrogenase